LAGVIAVVVVVAAAAALMAVRLISTMNHDELLKLLKKHVLARSQTDAGDVESGISFFWWNPFTTVKAFRILIQ
jgi:hypothetical protein